MSAPLQFHVEPLDPAKHRREAFDCGVEPLNVFLKTRANREAQVFASACYVLVPTSEPARIAGYYTLSATTIGLKEIAVEKQAQLRLPKSYPELGAVLVGRLARDLAFAEHRIGEKLIFSALFRSYREAKKVGAVAVVVDSKSAEATQFYQRYGFIPLDGSRLWLPMRDVPHWCPAVSEP